MQHSVSVQRDEKAWSRKRRTDGMRLFALHPDLDLTAEDAVELYSMKNTVEVDFRLIKSVLHVRPVHHQTDRKVRSHVDICVLALAIERALNDALPPSLSAAMALEELASVRLVDVAPNAQAKRRFALTGTTTSQRDIINHLKMSGLLEL